VSGHRRDAHESQHIHTPHPNREAATPFSLTYAAQREIVSHHTHVDVLMSSTHRCPLSTTPTYPLNCTTHCTHTSTLCVSELRLTVTVLTAHINQRPPMQRTCQPLSQSKAAHSADAVGVGECHTTHQTRQIEREFIHVTHHQQQPVSLPLCGLVCVCHARDGHPTQRVRMNIQCVR